ncbi:MAG: class I SAM-dependent methyltransferase [Candidatus Eisenbacteria bacterium]
MREPLVSDSTYFFDPETYDQVYAGFTADLPHYLELVKHSGGAVLEVACGNGRLLIPALEAGVACDGLDYDRGMLDDLRRKLAASGRAASLFEADMRDFTLSGRYALITIAFNSFLHNLTQEDQLATLRCCLRHLEPGGRLAIIVFHPSAAKLVALAEGEILAVDQPLAVGRIRVYDHSDDDRVEQTRLVTRRIEYLDAAGRVAAGKTFRFRLRYVFKPEMELLLRAAGFARWDMRPLFSNYSDPASAAGGRAAREGDNLLWTAWKT